MGKQPNRISFSSKNRELPSLFDLHNTFRGSRRSILTILGKEEDEFDFVEDRSGHHLRYVIDATKTIDELGWEPRFTDFESGLREVVHSYLK